MTDQYLLLFYTEENPYDNGYNLVSNINKIKDTLSPYFKEIFTFSKRELKMLEGSENVCNEYDSRLHPHHNVNSNNIGFFDFKPFLIKHALTQILENSVLLYHDSNFGKYSQYWDTDWENIQNYLTEDIFISREVDDLKVKTCVKNYTLSQILKDPESVRIVEEKWLLAASKILMRNTLFTRQFIDEWHLLCQDKSLILTEDPNPHPEFGWNCGDQDTLNCLAYKYVLEGKLSQSFPGLYFVNRIWNNYHKQITDNYNP
jgi:hypothetical protein